MGIIVEACWKGYKQAGLKKKGDRMVPNCVPINENINVPIKVGDTVLGGKFKNKRIVIKSIDKNEKGDITINGKPLLKIRIIQEGKDVIGIVELGCSPRRKGESESDFKRRCSSMYTYAFPLYMTSKKEDEPQQPTTPPVDSETPPESPTPPPAVPSGDVSEVSDDETEMIDGVVDMLNQVTDIQNRKKMALDKLKDFEKEGIEVDIKTFLKRVGMALVSEDWSQKYKSSIDCNNPKGFSQKAHCQGRKKNESLNEITLASVVKKSDNFKEFVKEFYKEYKDFPKDRDTIKWLSGIYTDIKDGAKTQSISENSLSDLEKKLKSHDWWYAYSDDNRKYTNGRANWFEITKMIRGMKGNKEAEKLWNKYVPKDFNYSFKELSEETNEDLRKWFGKGKTGSSGGGGWDRYGSDGQNLGKCGGGDDGDAYAACLSKEKAAKLGPKGRAAFVRRKRGDQKKAGDSKKGGESSKGQKPTMSKTGA